MRRGVLIMLLGAFLIFSINHVSAIRINEVELNPAGTDNGNEWIELYSDSNIDVTGWYLENVKGRNMSLNLSFSDYAVISTPYQFLTNTKQKLKLIDSEGNVIDETGEMTDSANDAKTWQFCTEWIFQEESIGEENNCNIRDEEVVNNTVIESIRTIEQTSNNKSVSQNNKLSEEDITNKVDNTAKQNIIQNNAEPEIIRLEPVKMGKDIKTYKSRNQYIKEYLPEGFTVFLALVLMTLMIRWKKFKQEV
jgi:hypothetical protein